MAEWKCHIELPAEHFEKLLLAWKDNWYAQLKTQIEYTDTEKQALSQLAQNTAEDYKSCKRLSNFMKRNVPEYNAGEEEGVDNWVARFKWEYPWEVVFVAVDAEDPQRKFYKNIPVVTELMAEMGAADMDQDVDASMTQAQAAGLEPRGAKRPPSTPAEELERKEKQQHEAEKADQGPQQEKKQEWKDWTAEKKQDKHTPQEMEEWRAQKAKDWAKEKRGGSTASSSWDPNQQSSLLPGSSTDGFTGLWKDATGSLVRTGAGSSLHSSAGREEGRQGRHGSE